MQEYDWPSSIEASHSLLAIYSLKAVPESFVFLLSFLAADESPAHRVGRVGQQNCNHGGKISQTPLLDIIFVILISIEYSKVAPSEYCYSEYRNCAACVQRFESLSLCRLDHCPGYTFLFAARVI